ncbi:LOW QUALITY PROTEIN: hypothetical protein ACHAXS_002710 [Conticribra weissflogii]
MYAPCCAEWIAVALPLQNKVLILGINFVWPPFHNFNVFLVLIIFIGLYSPQFHVLFDDFVETIYYQDRVNAANTT